MSSRSYNWWFSFDVRLMRFLDNQASKGLTVMVILICGDRNLVSLDWTHADPKYRSPEKIIDDIRVTLKGDRHRSYYLIQGSVLGGHTLEEGVASNHHQFWGSILKQIKHQQRPVQLTLVQGTL